MAVLAHRCAAAHHDPHVNHGPLADDGADVDDGAHHDDGTVPDRYLIADDGPGFNAGIDVFNVQQRNRRITAVVFDHHVGNFVAVRLNDGTQLLPVPENDLVAAAEHLRVAVINGGFFLNGHFDRGLFFRFRDIADDFLSVHHGEVVLLTLLG